MSRSNIPSSSLMYCVPNAQLPSISTPLRCLEEPNGPSYRNHLFKLAGILFKEPLHTFRPRAAGLVGGNLQGSPARSVASSRLRSPVIAYETPHFPLQSHTNPSVLYMRRATVVLVSPQQTSKSPRTPLAAVSSTAR